MSISLPYCTANPLNSLSTLSTAETVRFYPNRVCRPFERLQKRLTLAIRIPKMIGFLIRRGGDEERRPELDLIPFEKPCVRFGRSPASAVVEVSHPNPRMFEFRIDE